MNQPVFSCSRCGEAGNPAAAACSHFGVYYAPERPKPAICPRCKCLLHSFDMSGHAVDRCPSCEGVWLDRTDLQHAPTLADVVAEECLIRLYGRKPVQLLEGNHACPRCGDLMKRSNYRTISGVIVDSCPSCGWWLDADEIDKIRAFLADGGACASKSRSAQVLRQEKGEDAAPGDGSSCPEHSATAFLHRITRLFI